MQTLERVPEQTAEGTQRTVEHARRRWLAISIGVIYSVSFWKFVKRDPLSGSLGIEAVLEIGSVTLACALTILLAMERGLRRRFGPVPAMLYLGVFGLFTTASAFRSFSVSLSLTKSVLFFAVMGMAYLLAQMGLSWEFLEGIYAGFVGIVLLGLAVGAAFPSRYPMILSEEFTGRNRLALFDTHPNGIGETCALMFLLGWLLGGRRRWIPQVLLLVINVLAGERTASSALVGIGCLAFLLVRRWTPLRAFAIAAVVAAIAVAAAIQTSNMANVLPEKYLASVQGIYGKNAANELQTLDGRQEVWAAALRLAGDGVLIGYGFEGAREALIQAVSWSGQAHNAELELMLDAGIFGSALFALGWWMLVVMSLDGNREWTVKVGAIHGLILVMSIVGPIFDFYSFMAEALGISLAYLALERASRAREMAGAGGAAEGSTPIPWEALTSKSRGVRRWCGGCSRGVWL